MKYLKTTICIVIIFVVLIFSSAAIKMEENYQKRQHVSTFTTSFSTSSENRKHNIRLATSNFAWLQIPAKHKLSFNEIVGKRSLENGYKNAIVISYGEYVEGVGGGVCQVSTTLYNSWIRAGLEVIEVKNHTLPASYVELSQDATVSDYQDLILFNNTSNTVVINGYSSKDSLTFDIYANKMEYEIKIETVIIDKINPPPPKEEKIATFADNNVFYDGNRNYVILKNAKVGYKSKSIMKYFKNGEYLFSKQIREDYYLPIQGTIGVLE